MTWKIAPAATRRLLPLLILCMVTLLGGAQSPKADFGPPLDIPLYLSGNFAEMRGNHFHTGIDIKTQGVEGKRVLAAESGVISRINVSPWGYGNALYIDHPNGHTTVYGHLQSFAPAIEKVLRQKQYEAKSFAVDFTPEETIRVEKGEFIALSGNSGGSGGPHLHFEIRDTETEHPLNPLLFGFDIVDDIPPRIRGVRFHPLSDTTLINGEHKAQSFVVHGSDGRYRLKRNSPVEVYGAFGLSLHALDFLNGYPNRCGIYSLDLQVDSATVCRQVFDELDFSTVRHINAYKAYDVYVTNRWHYHKSFVLPGNELDIYRPFPDRRGVLSFEADGVHRVDYTATDAYGNASHLGFEIRSLATPPGPLPTPTTYDAYFHWDRSNEFSYRDEFTLRVPEGALYEDLPFEFNWQRPDEGTYTPHYTAQTELVPLQKPVELSFDVADIPESIRSKLVLARYDMRGRASYTTGSVAGHTFSALSKYFGKFTLVADTTAPTIRPVSLPTPRQGAELSFTIRDDRTGIFVYNAYLNGRWILAEYDPKNSRLTVRLDEQTPTSGEVELRIELADGTDNTTTWNRKWNL